MDAVSAGTPSPEGPFDLLAIERELRPEVEGKAAFERYDKTLVALADRLGCALAEGMTPAAYRRCEDLEECVILARKLLRLARWNQ